MRFPLAGVVALMLPFSAGAQTAFCPTGRWQPDFGWRGTDCGRCNIYGSYLEYLTEPQIRDISANGPAAGKLREHDALVAVDGSAITTETAWRRLRDARPGDTVRFTVRREGSVVQTSVVAASRCFDGVSGGANLAPFVMRDSTGRRVGHRFLLGETSVDVEGPVDAVMYDAKSGDVLVRIGTSVVKVHAKVPK